VQSFGGYIVQRRYKTFAILTIGLLLLCIGCGKFFVSPDALVTMSLSPQASITSTGQTVTLTATGTDGNNNTKDVTSTANWSSSASNVASVTAGTVTAGTSTGAATISAAQDGVTGTATITVTASPLQSIAISPTTTSYALSQGTQQFTATGTLQNGSTIDLTNLVQWSSSSTATATINSATGLASFVAAGQTTISAKIATGSSTNVTATINITVS